MGVYNIKLRVESYSWGLRVVSYDDFELFAVTVYRIIFYIRTRKIYLAICLLFRFNFAKFATDIY